MIKENELEEYFTYDKPVPYKELLIYPVKVVDYLNFFISVNCLTFEKNKIPDPNIIKMSYLDFLFYTFEKDENGKVYLMMLLEIFKICLNINYDQIKYAKDENDKINFIFNLEDEYSEYKNITVNKNDFDNIKKIILLQNIPDYDDTYIDPKVEAALKEAQEFMNRNKKKISSLEDQIICVMLALNEVDNKKIHNLTIRKFTKILQRYDYKLHYEIYKTASMSGFVSFKEDIDHWMSELSSKKYSDVIIDYGEFKSKIESAKV